MIKKAPHKETPQKRGSDRIVDHFTSRILSGEMSPGDKLPSEGHLCEHFSASRTVVREAMQQLKALGAIDIINGKGSFIAQSRINHFQNSLQLYSSRTDEPKTWLDLIDLRFLIETECVKKLASQTKPKAVASIQAAMEAMIQARHDLRQFANLDIEFHQAIVATSDNHLFKAVWNSIKDMNLRFANVTYQSPSQIETTLDQHRKIYQAIASCRPDDAAICLQNHLNHSRDNLLLWIEQTRINAQNAAKEDDSLPS
ncbi:FadR family transcriptional regulator [Verrucomicrobiaceae bacterium N1E253]|uniref:FadR family transcriptional regulator n=1 Tax=Oceaniferula marina TaxID=2748318 RepID=A0A851GM70_9BACT|nr:FadR/GntR family transcriptional regulator [Oceaniferula marina]NWK56245.1 FadR family transcriptional regulator [Oceaniferula marina]